MAAGIDSTADRVVPEMTAPAAAILAASEAASAERTDIERELESFSPSVLNHLKQIYESLASNNGKNRDSKSGQSKLSRESLSHFLETVQRDHPAVAAKSSSLQKVLSKKGGDSSATIAQESELGHGDFNEFLSYMSSPASNAEATVVDPKYRDLSHPMSNYFVSSSHNTYLTGNQLYSESSTDAYKDVCDLFVSFCCLSCFIHFRIYFKLLVDPVLDRDLDLLWFDITLLSVRNLHACLSDLSNSSL